jgi:hypothetical protein
LLSITFFLGIAFLWVATYQSIPPVSKSDKTVFVDKEALFDVGSESEKMTDNPSSKRKIATG